jgi:hypothetical protein
MTAEDDAALLSAQGEGVMTEAAAKAKHKTKSQVLGLFQKAGKKMAGFHGDVAVDGTKQKASIDAGEEVDHAGEGFPERALKKVIGRGQIGAQLDKLLYTGYTKDLGTRECEFNSETTACH